MDIVAQQIHGVQGAPVILQAEKRRTASVVRIPAPFLDKQVLSQLVEPAVQELRLFETVVHSVGSTGLDSPFKQGAVALADEIMGTVARMVGIPEIIDDLA